MIWINLSARLAKLLVSWIALSLFLTSQVMAKGVKIVQPPPGQGAPPPPPPAIRRPICSKLPPTALVPMTTTQSNGQAGRLAWGKTTEKHPTLWFYFPYGSDAIYSIRLSLRDRAGRPITPDAFVTSPKMPGIVSIVVPSTAPPLKNGWYQAKLFVTVWCKSGQQSEMPSVNVWVVHEELSNSLKDGLSQAKTPFEKASFYAQQGYWFDAISNLAELRRKNQNSEDWNSLLESAGLKDAAKQPIVDCCTLESQR
jgi:hypothetical protein